MGYEKLMRRERGKRQHQKCANQIDKHEHFPGLSAGAVLTAS